MKYNSNDEGIFVVGDELFLTKESNYVVKALKYIDYVNQFFKNMILFLIKKEELLEFIIKMFLDIIKFGIIFGFYKFLIILLIIIIILTGYAFYKRLKLPKKRLYK